MLNSCYIKDVLPQNFNEQKAYSVYKVNWRICKRIYTCISSRLIPNFAELIGQVASIRCVKLPVIDFVRSDFRRLLMLLYTAGKKKSLIHTKRSIIMYNVSREVIVTPRLMNNFRQHKRKLMLFGIFIVGQRQLSISVSITCIGRGCSEFRYEIRNIPYATWMRHATRRYVSFDSKQSCKLDLCLAENALIMLQNFNSDR